MAAKDIDACLEATKGNSLDPQGDLTTLKRWYCRVSVMQPNPSRADLEKIYRDYEDLPPPGRPVPTHVDSLQIDDG